MCDCFHLAFPNWHAPAAGAGRRLRGPEQGAEDDSVCEEPEILEQERPRPQGSSPVEEFPVEKQGDEDISDLPHKAGSNKKSKKAGFGSLFDKRPSEKMDETEDMQSGESDMIVKTVKEACVEGLVVSGGGKEGIFIKEVIQDSPASKHLSVKEGDQILSATVYFDNVSYEDALQILEHAQPYKMEFCLRRKVEPSIPENTQIILPKEKGQGSPVMRSERKMKKQQERISWPKFPSFGKGPRVQFKRSHSTSEAEEHRKLEMSPPTSDTDSPLKSPLKCPDGKDKKKKHKVQLKMKMKGHRSKSVEEPQNNENLVVWENQKVEDILEEKVSEGHEEKKQGMLQVLDGAEYESSSKTGNNDPFQSLSGMGLHEAHLISLGNTLKTTNISVALAEGGKIESSEMKVKIDQKEKPDIGTEALYTISDPSAYDDNVVLSQTKLELSQLDNDFTRPGIEKDSLEKKIQFENTEHSMPNVDICVGETKISPRIENEKHLKERSIFENQSYGIRTRGPLADMATSKTHFVSTVNGIQFISPDFSEITQIGKMSDGISDAQKQTVIFHTEPGSSIFAADKKDSSLEIKASKLSTETTDFIQADLDKRSVSKFKLPKVDDPGFITYELNKMTEVDNIKPHLPKREDIEIPGMETKETKPSLQTPEIRVPKIEKIINITKQRDIQKPQTNEDFNVEDVKVAVSKFPAFKLPEGDITGVLVQREITIMDLKSDKSVLTPRGSPHKTSIKSTDSSTSVPQSKVGEEKSPASDPADKYTAFAKMPMVELPYIDEQTSTAVIKTDYTEPQTADYRRFEDINFKLPKREDIEIPGMEAIKESKLQGTVISEVIDVNLDQAEKPKTKKYSDKKGHEKKSKKPKITVQAFEIAKPDISTELPKKDSLKMDTGETNINEIHKFKTPKIGEVENLDFPVQEAKILEDNMDNVDLQQKTETKYGKKKFKIPSIALPEFGTKVPKGAVDISAVDVHVKEPKTILPEDKLKLSIEPLLSDLDGTDVNKDGQSVSVCARAQDPEPEGQGKKFKLPKFELSFPEVKAPKIICTSKKDDDSSVSEESGEVPIVLAPKGELPDVKPEVSANLPHVDSEIAEVKIKRPGFSFPRFGTSKSGHTAPAADVSQANVNISLPEGYTEIDDPNINVAISVKDGKQKDATKFGSPTKFKIPLIKFPHFGAKVTKAAIETSDLDVNVKGAQISLPDTEVNVSAETTLYDTEDVDKKKKSMEFIKMDIQSEAQGTKVNLPKFNISPPEVKKTNKDISLNQAEIKISVPKEKVQVTAPDIGTPEVKVNLPVDLDKVNIPKRAVEISGVNVGVKSSEISLTDAKIEVSAEPLLVDINGPDMNNKMGLGVIMKKKDIKIEGQESMFKLPHAGISLPEVKIPKFHISSDKSEIDLSMPKEKVEVHPPDVKVHGVTDAIRADLPEVEYKGIEVKMKTPGFSFPKIGFSKSEVKGPKGDVILPNVDVSLAEGSLEMERPPTGVTVEDAEQKVQSTFGSPTKFKLPSVNFPKFGAKVPKFTVEASNVDIDGKGPEISLPDAEMKLSAEPISLDIKGPDADKEMKPLAAEMKGYDIHIKEQESKFKLPRLGISLPETKGPNFDASSNKAEIDISGPKATVEMLPPDVGMQGVTAEIKANLPEIESKDIEVKMKTPGFSFSKIGLTKSEVTGPDVEVSLPNVDVSLPEGSLEMERPTTDVVISMEDAEQKDRSKFGSPTKFKLPSINFPKFGAKVPKVAVEASDVDVAVKGPEISLPDARIELSSKPISVDKKGPDADIEMKPLTTEMKDHDIHIKEQGSKFKLPRFGISLSETKGPKFDAKPDKAEIDISGPKATVEMLPPDVGVQGVTAEIKADLPEVKSTDIEVKMKTPGFSFPKTGFGKSDIKAPEGDVSLSNVDVSLPEVSKQMERPTADVTISMENAEQNVQSTIGSPTKFKLPSVNFPKFETKVPNIAVKSSDVDIDIKRPEISLPDAEMRLSAEPISVDIKGPNTDIEIKSPGTEMKDHDIHIQEQRSKFKLPKFGIGLPEIKIPKVDASSDKAEIEMHPPDIEMQGLSAEIKADLPEVESKDIEVKMKTPGFSFPKIAFGKTDVTGPEADLSLPNVDVSLPKESIEIERPTADVTISVENAEQKGQSKFGSPTKFKLPSISFPKFGTKVPKVEVEVSDVNVGAKGPEIGLPDKEIKLSAEPISVDMKGPDGDIEIKPLATEMKDHDIKMKEKGSKFKLPKFGISLPEIKGPQFDARSDKAEIDISIPKATAEVHPPDIEVQGVTAEIKANLPELESKNIEVKMKTPGFSFPKMGFSKSEVKAPKGEVSLPNVDMSSAEGSIEMERPTADITISMEDAEQKGQSKFGSPTKFKLPSVNFPKFGTRVPKVAVDVSDVNVDVKGPEMSLPAAEIKLSAEPLTVDIKGPNTDIEIKSPGTEIKDHDIHIKEQGSKFKLPKFGISLPEIKTPKFDASTEKAEIDISGPKATVEVGPSNVEVQSVTTEIKANLAEVKSKDIEEKIKTPGFSFPKGEFIKSEITGPDVDVSLPNVDVSLSKVSIEMEKPTTDVTISMQDAEQKDRSKFGSPTKFKLPSLNFPKFGTKVPKIAVEVSDVNVDVKGPEISLPDEKIKLSAEPVSMDIKGPDADIKTKLLTSEMKGHDIHIKEQGSKFKLPKFGISLPEIKGPKFDASSDKTETDISGPKATVERHPPDVGVHGVTAGIKADLPEVESKDIEVKMKTPGFSFPKIGFNKSQIKASEVDVSLPNVDVSLPEGSLEMERPTADVAISVEDAEQKGRSKFGSPTKFKLPSVNFPKFGTRVPKVAVEASDMHVDVKGPEISLPDAEIKLSAEPISLDIKGPDADKEMKPLAAEMKGYDIHIKEQESKFKLPKFGISLPETKGPKFDASLDKAEIDISGPKATVEMLPPDVGMQGVTAEIKADLPEVDSKDIEVRMKTPGFSFSKIGFGKSEVTGPDVDVSLPNVDVSLPKGSIEMERPTTDVTMENAEQKDRSKFGSPTKFKLPSINFPKFGTKVPKVAVEVSDVDKDVKGPEISLRDAEVKLSAEPITVNMKGPDPDIEITSPSTEIKGHDIQMKEQGSKFKLPKFGISLPEIKGPNFDASSNKAEIDISGPKATVEMLPPDVGMQGVTAEIKATLPEIESKDIEVKMKTPGFSFSKIGLTKSEVTGPDVDVSLPNVNVSLPKGSIEMERPTTDVTMEDAEQKDRSKFGSPTKFKLPSLTFPKFGTKVPKVAVEVSDVDKDVKGPEISLPDAEVKLSAEPITVNMKGPDADVEISSPSTEIKGHDIQMKAQGSKFKLPKFGISLPEIKEPNFDASSNKAEIDISGPTATVEMHQPNIDVQGVTAEIKANLPDVESKDIEVKMKTPGFSFPKIGFSKSQIKASEVDVSLPNVDVSLPEGSLEMERPTADVAISMEDAEQKGRSKFGSPTKFKLPSVNFPKFGTKVPKVAVEASDVHVDVKGPEISLSDAEIKLSAEPISLDIKGPDANKEMKPLATEIKGYDIHIKEQESKFKLPRFGISLPEIKGPKFDASLDKAEIDISGPKATVEMLPPDVGMQGVTAEIKADLPEVESKDIEVRMKTPGFSFSKIGFGKSEVTGPDVDVSLPNVDVSLPKGSIEMERPTTDVTISVEDAEQKGRSKFGSPTKFKLPSINFPKFGTKVPKVAVEVSDVDKDVKGPEISLPDAEVKLSAEPITVNMKGPDADIEITSPSTEIKGHDIQMKEQGSKFKLPKFGISLPEIKGPNFEASSNKAEIDISGPKATVEMLPPDVGMQGVTAEIKANLPEVESKDIEVKMKTPGFSFPKVGLTKSEVTGPDVDVSLPNVDVSLPKGSIEMERPTTDVTMEDAEQKDRSKFGSPTKFKLPSINFPKFGTKVPKVAVEVSDVDKDVKGPEISLPDAQVKLSAEPITVDMNGPDADIKITSPSTEIKGHDIEMKEQGGKFKLPKFGISLPEIKGPKFDASANKAEIDISGPKATVEMHQPNIAVQGVTAEIKANLPDVESKDVEVKMKTPGFSFPKIGFSKSQIKASEVDVSLPNVDVSLPKGSTEMERPTTDVTISVEDAEQKGRSKFGSPTKFKLPSLTFPKFGTKGPKASVELSGVDVDVKGPEISLPDAEIKLTAEPLTVDIKGPDADKEMKPLSTETKVHDIQMKEKGSKFKLPEFGIRLPEMKTPKFDDSSQKAEIDISGPKATVEIHPPEVQSVTAEMRADLPESEDIEVKMKTPGFSFPKIKFSKSDVTSPKGDVSLPNVDVSLSKGSTEIEKPTTDVTISMEGAEQKGQSIFGSPTKFKLPSINFPKFGTKRFAVEVSDVDVDVKGSEISQPDSDTKLSTEPISVEIKGPDADIKMKPLATEMKGHDIYIKEQGSKFKLPKFGISLPEVEGSKLEASTDKTDISVLTAKVKVHPPDMEVQDVTADLKANFPELDSKSNVPADDLSLQTAVSFPEESIKIEGPAAHIIESVDMAGQNDATKSKPQPKLKLPPIKLPKFGVQKETVEISSKVTVVKGPEISLPDADLSTESLLMDIKGLDVNKDDNFGVKGPQINIISKRSSKAESSIYLKKEVNIQTLDGKVKKFKNNSEVAIPELDSQVGKYGDSVLNGKTQVVTTSSKFTLPTLGDIFSGFEVEFNVPKFNEIEETKQNYPDPPKDKDNIAVRGQVSTSPTKTAKDNGKLSSHLTKKVHSPQSDLNDKSKKSFTGETDEDNVSPTLSLSSSDAFADVSSALTSEQTGLSLASPTKVKVKYSEPTANAELSDISDIHGNIITSTARTELISMEPHQPEKVNIPFSSETSSSSVDTLKEMSGHIVVSNVQSVSKTEHAAFLTEMDIQHIQTLPLEKVTDSLLSAEETMMRKGHTIVQKHVVKEIFGDDKEKIFVTQRIQVFEGDSTEPISEDTASSIQKLRDTVHTEKIRFFEGAESSKTVLMSTETLLRHVDSSTDENEGK